MGSLFLTTFISCQQLHGILLRIQKNEILNPIQKQAITSELIKIVPSCPIVIKNNGSK